MTDPILVTRDSEHSGIAILTFNRPEAHNALSLEGMVAFASIIDQLAADNDLRALILTGAGEKSFCSGADIADLNRMATAADAEVMITRMGDALLKMECLPVPVIAAVNGYALGGGAETALACDVRIADETARLGFVQIKRGLIPGWGGGQRLMRQVGYARALDILLRAQTLNTPELLSLGLVNQVVPKGEALAGGLDFARQIANHDRAVVAALKSALQAGLSQPYESALMTERALFPPLWEGEARAQSMQDFLNRKRT